MTVKSVCKPYLGALWVYSHFQLKKCAFACPLATTFWGYFDLFLTILTIFRNIKLTVWNSSQNPKKPSFFIFGLFLATFGHFSIPFLDILDHIWSFWPFFVILCCRYEILHRIRKKHHFSFLAIFCTISDHFGPFFGHFDHFWSFFMVWLDIIKRARERSEPALRGHHTKH